jgi:hypothetical protein
MNLFRRTTPAAADFCDDRRSLCTPAARRRAALTRARDTVLLHGGRIS